MKRITKVTKYEVEETTIKFVPDNQIKEYKGVKYLVYKNTHIGTYCGYVRLPDNHPYIKLLSKKVEIGLGKQKIEHYDYDSVPVSCHGGVTFGEYVEPAKLEEGDNEQKLTEGWWIGWDYAHFGDYMNFGFPSALAEDGHKWTEEEVENECEEVIDQIIAGGEQNGQ